ncbi:16S rRNA (guanine(527)-N(7))-methyltransferase RsmG [Thermosyntropha sp.]|uniref:16S rRNA (guanine(527)-N(7))-methyltransferase RsmG n=1 Tax=Thermosyntropha sp. TaxID=2740820 RepID=UPI0026014D06|nr:16S rRNA (guanine(527)-N(7))-methyltransferase RsmG [Thermosyntropha sp.]MBO8159688.1 16S rRNA (guanine(527)-N(7))-methyltransferase RsmG [Thermosyntropha sp.]
MEYIVIKYKDLLLQENEKHNLVSRRVNKEDLDQHIKDSLAILDFVSLAGNGVDIGSGAGFPGLILAMHRRETFFTLIESDLKKSSFLQRVKEECRIINVEVLRDRAENVGRNLDFREKFDFCTSRAVASMNVMIEYALPLLKKGGKAYMWKGPSFEEEIRDAENALKILGGRVDNIYSYSLSEEKKRYIVVIEKTGKTPEKYPRRTGMPSKRPL